MTAPTVPRARAGVLLLLLLPPLAPAAAQAGPGAPGPVDFKVSCSTRAQLEFNQAVTLLHHMTYPQARAAFQRVAAIDPRCAMAHWGVAMTLFQSLWPTRPGPDALRQGWQEVQTANGLEPPTVRERLFVNATRAFFVDPASSDYWLRIRRWKQAMDTLYASFPDDAEVAAFYGLALLATAPTDTASRTTAARAAGILQTVYDRRPGHPGAMHYLIHANDAPGRERESLEITRGYEAAAPENPHALHMPTHIYTRLGDWDGVIRGNLRAAEAALAYPAGDHGQFVWDEFPHALEYLIYAYLQKGADDSASAQLTRLLTTGSLEPSFKTAFHLASTRARYALERHAWSDAAGLEARQPPGLDWDRFAWPEAITRFAHGLGAAHLGRLGEARDDTARLSDLESSMRAAGEELFARNIRILDLELGAWLAHAGGQEDSSVALLRQAAGLESSTPKHAVTPAPTLPAYELLGDLLMELNRPAEALEAYRRALDLYPRRFNSLLGAARAARALGDIPLASGFYEQLLQMAGAGTREAALDEARRNTHRKQ
ncbi:MAG: tetratricopeptide repeat protein [Gemmatimonadales bacterium]